MKLERQSAIYVPITLILETQEELDTFTRLLKNIYANPSEYDPDVYYMRHSLWDSIKAMEGKL